MLKKRASSKKKWIIAPIAGVVTAAVVAGALYDSAEVAMAKPSLPGIEELVENNSFDTPFTILELVGDKTDAAMGYLVDGEEPIYLDALRDNRILAISDMASKAERTERVTSTYASAFGAFTSLQGADGPFTWTDLYEEVSSGSKQRSTYGNFVEVATANGDYKSPSAYSEVFYPVVDASDKDDTTILIPKATISDVVAWTTDNPPSTGVLYADLVNFEYLGDSDKTGIQTYDIIFDEVSDSTYQSPYRMDDYDDACTIDGQNYKYYNAQYYITDERVTCVYHAEVAEETDPETGDIITPHQDEYVSMMNTFASGTTTYVYQLTSSGDYQRAGSIYEDAAGKWVFDDGTNPAIVLQDDTITYDTDGVTILPDTFAEKLYTEELNNNIIYLYTIREYDSNYGNDAQRRGERLYIKNLVDKGVSGTGLYAASESPKTAVVISGQEAGAYGIDVNENMSYKNSATYHAYFFIPANNATYTFTSSDDGDYLFEQNYSGAIIESYKYNNGFANNEWFKKYVLDREDSECAGTIVQVVTKLYSEATPEDVEKADLIYIRCTDSTVIDATNAMKDDTAKAIVESVKYNKAIIIENKKIFNKTDITNTVIPGTAAMNKLAVSLGQGDISDSVIETLISDGVWNSLTPQATYDSYVKKMFNAEDASSGTYVNRTVFVVDGDAVTKDFNKELTDKTITKNGVTVGFEDVKLDIKNEVFYLDINGVDSSKFNDKLTIATCIRHILNYGDRRIISKDSLKVLDIEPYYSEVVEADPAAFFGGANNVHATRDTFDRDWFITNVTDTVKREDVTVDGIGIKEFVGNIKDLNENYDLIYIGLDTQYLNTTSKQVKIGSHQESREVIDHYEGKGKNKKPVYKIEYYNVDDYAYTYTTDYNDNRMNGYVYSHFGDYLTVDSDEMGLHDKYRYTGLDLTFEKTRDLKEYIAAGYTVIVSDDFFTISDGKTVVNQSKISYDSYMYELGNWILDNKYYGENVRSKSDFTDGSMTDKQKERFASYLSIQKLNVEVTKSPTEYYNVSTDGSQTPIYSYLDMNRNGEYVLEYDVELENKSELASATYDCVLYIDTNADGRYSDSESLRHATVIEDSEGKSAPLIKGPVDEETGEYQLVYALETGKKYHISVKAEGVVGYVPWKLSFMENGNEKVRFAKTGACAIPSTTENKPTIKVLQITSGDDTGAARNMNGNNTRHAQKGYTPGWIWYGTNLDLSKDANGMQALYNQVQDFDIEITKISAENFVYNENGSYSFVNNKNAWNVTARERTESMIAYLHSYDMVVLGFTEAYWYPYKGSNATPSYCGMYALREYILSGNSVLFSHDLTTNHTSNADINYIGWFANRYLRDLQGMDRFGVIEKSGNLNELSQKAGMGNTYTLPKYNSKYDNPTYNNNISYTYTGIDGSEYRIAEGASESRLMRYADNSGFNDTGFAGRNENKNKHGDINDNWGYKYLTAANGRNGWTVLDMEESSTNNGKNNSNTIYVHSVNTGQITEYPFHIPSDEDIIVSNTHAQFFQLNLDTDSRDANETDDVVVWYAISNQNKAHKGYYTINYNDARNNYYIYNKGNITYTGAGHSPVNVKDSNNNSHYNDIEQKLFINTLVAAYNAGSHAPRAVFKDKADKYGADVTAIYEPYDMNAKVDGSSVEGEVAVDEINYNFKVTNTNLKNTYTDEQGDVHKKIIYAQYYVEVPAGTSGAITIGSGDSATYYLVVPADKFTVEQRTDKNGNSITPVEVTNPYVLDSNCIYSVSLDTDLITDSSNIQSVSYGTDYAGNAVTVSELRKHNYKICVRLSFEQDSAVRGNMNTSLDILPSTDSISSLSINFTDLYELK